MTPTAEQIASELLPCNPDCRVGDDDHLYKGRPNPVPHLDTCPAKLRPAVAAAIETERAKQDTLTQEIENLRKDMNELDVELGSAQRRLIEKDAQIIALRGELEKERDKGESNVLETVLVWLGNARSNVKTDEARLVLRQLTERCRGLRPETIPALPKRETELRLASIEDRPELTALLKEAVERFNAMSPDEQEVMLRKQRESWARQDYD